MCLCLYTCVCRHIAWFSGGSREIENGVKEANSNHKLPEAFIHGPPQHNYTLTHIHPHLHTCSNIWSCTSRNVVSPQLDTLGLSEDEHGKTAYLFSICQWHQQVNCCLVKLFTLPPQAFHFAASFTFNTDESHVELGPSAIISGRRWVTGWNREIGERERTEI